MTDAKKMVKTAEEIRMQAAQLRDRAERLHIDFSRIIATLKKNGGTLQLAR